MNRGSLDRASLDREQISFEQSGFHFLIFVVKASEQEHSFIFSWSKELY